MPIWFLARQRTSRREIERRLADRRIPRAAPVLMLGARFAFALATHGLVAAVCRIRREPNPWQSAARWWMVDGTLVDLGCLLALDRLTRREGLGVLDLLSDEPIQLRRELLGGIGALAALAPAVALSGALQRTFYGDDPFPPQVTVVRLPGWAAAYSVALWPAVWGLTEELTFLGYALPRLEVQTGNTGLAAALVSLAWAGQHVAMPLLPGDRRYLAARALTALPITAAMTTYFLLRGRRLTPLVLAHWASDAGTAVTAIVAARRAQ